MKVLVLFSLNFILTRMSFLLFDSDCVNGRNKQNQGLNQIRSKMKQIKAKLKAAVLTFTLTFCPLLSQLNVQAQIPVAPTQFRMIDLTPDGVSSAIQGISSFQQVGKVGGFLGGVGSPTTHAFLWSDVGLSPVDLHPSFLDFPELNSPGNSVAYATDTVNQVGSGVGAATNQRTIALRWSGTAESAEVLLPPFNNHGAEAFGTCNGQAVGYGRTVEAVNGRGTVRQVGGPLHAVLWNSNSTIGIDLNNGAQATVALACDGSQQVGYGGSMDISGQLAQPKAMMWFGNRNNFVFLHPNGYASSQAVAVSGGIQVGHAEIQFQTGRQISFNSRAVVWSGSAASMVTLPLPSGFIFNYFATSVSNGMVAGYGIDTTNNQKHALYWASASTPVVDLNQFLPPGYIDASANGIDSSGRIVGKAYSGTSYHAVMWVPVP
ncbi:MAG: hypothetical protein M3033_12995 [Acidobacteriota bacterium]|nr:hypothetical protein [Acidobacteriota bacterium]